MLVLHDVEAARRRLAGSIRRTPCHFAPAMAELAGVSVWLKREDLQRTGAFKERGARHALLCLTDAERSRGVVAASAGNHALGLAFHGATLGAKLTVVMPTGASPVKIERCRGLGAAVVLHGRSFDDAQAFALEFASQSGATPIHPFDNLNVIAGQGTIALELLEQTPEVDTVVVPVGGGGLLAGMATVLKARRPGVRVIAVEPENAAGFLAACVRQEPCRAAVTPTLADGLAVACVGATAFALAFPLVDDVVTVNERELVAAISVLARRAGIVAEGAGAAGVAAVLAGKIPGRAIVLPISGRNVDVRLHEQVVASVTDARTTGALARAA